MAKSAAMERCHYRARVNDYAKAYNEKIGMRGWHMHVCKSFPNLHMRRKHPGWLREWRPQREVATDDARANRRRLKEAGEGG